MKKNFIKSNWATMLIVGLFIAAAIYYMDLILGIVSVIFVVTLINRYIKYDAEEQVVVDWWNGLSKEEKKEIHHKKTEYKEVGTDEN